MRYNRCKDPLRVVLTLGIGVAMPVLAQDPATEPAPPAAAAGQPLEAADDVGEVIVTARRIEEKLQDVPISITVFNQEQLSDRNVNTATDLANFTPSLAANNNYGSENTSFALRGFAQEAGTAPSVGTYFADVVAPRGPTQGTQAGDGVGPGSFFDLQNVQVLKGPQGTLFGRNTTGGAVLLVPQKPTSEAGGYVEASVGNYGMQRYQGVFNTPLGEKARFRLAADHQLRDGYVHNTSGRGPDEYNDINYGAVRASLVLDLTANIENYTIGSYSKSDTNGAVQKLIACNPTGYAPVNPETGLRNFIGVFSCAQLDREAAEGAGFYDVEAAIDNPMSRIEQWQVINTTTWNATDLLTLKNVASYAEYKNVQRTALFGVNWQVEDLPQPYPSIFFFDIPSRFTGIFPAPGARTASQSTYTEELQLQGSSADGKLVYQAGAYFEWSDPIGDVGNQSPTLVECSNPDTLECTDPLGMTFTALQGFVVPVHVGAVNYTVGRTSYRGKGLYTQSTYALNEQWKLTGGLRYTWDEQRNQATRISYRFPVQPPYSGGATGSCTDPGTADNGCRNSGEKKSSAPTWLLGVDYTPGDDLLLYGKYARGYRSGGVFSNAPSDLRTFDEEKVDNFELGFKTSFREVVRGTFNVAAFYNDFSNQQLQLGFNPHQNDDGSFAPVAQTTAIGNVGKSRIWGAEVETTLVPLKGLTFQLSYTYLNAEVRSIDPIDTDDPNYDPAVSAIAEGSPLVLSPRNKYSLAGIYTLPIDKRLGSVSFGLIFVHTDEQTSNYVYQDPAIRAAYGRDYGLLDSRDLLNANLGWEQVAGLPVDVSVFGTNLTDEEYYHYVPGVGASGAEFATFGEPRMYGMRLRYRFGA